ncbi:UDP-glucose:sterol glycosyltransferase [Cordyceps fumosorosea ARSEF 2679]|uniref:Sterol 3-beta-glucosyltransferase n=1 Tax=Cordyceps fumosorosea (strain ARSEF 2679) TaxID=1081104 RepID=A0A162JTV5_CORFA|nr:UDP-glucose:sterol glycosyltransferase [Cordyceps fumosorosea ARSEF 2679]OAA73722.1 UDP-glucose:sterol glycosyltransferase [Cordyceps fumosorosea ARSEF 2679]
MASSPPIPASGGPDQDLASRRRKMRRKAPGLSSSTPDLPEPLQDSDDSADEAHPQVMATPMSVNMNQSIFGLIAAAGSRVDFHTRFDGNSSDEDDGSKESPSGPPSTSQTTVLRPTAKHKKSLSKHRLLKSFATLPRLKAKSKHEPSKLSQPPPSAEENTENSDASDTQPSLAADARAPTPRRPSVMSRMLQARAEMSSRPSFDIERRSADLRPSEDDDETTPLARRLMEIFEFSEPEQVIEGAVASLTLISKPLTHEQNIPHVVAKSGYLSKSGKRNPKYNRYWFRLKGDVLSYYRDATNLYFPHGQIDLRFGISASVTDRDKDGLHFEVVTSQRTYNFRADSAPSAKEWVKSLQRVIFRSHNDGDSVKISLPIENIIDVEDTQMVEFSDTCKIRVIDNDETYAIDEYFFSFFSFGQEAIHVLKILVEDSTAKKQRGKGKILANVSSQTKNGLDKIHTSKVQEAVKATLSPRSAATSPRGSVEISSRTSRDGFGGTERSSHDHQRPLTSGFSDHSPRRSFSSSRPHSQLSDGGKTPRTRFFTSDSNLQSEKSSMEDPSFSSMTASGAEDPSASQILHGSDAFQRPTIMRSQPTDPGHSESLIQSQILHPGSDATFHLTRHAATTGHLDQLRREDEQESRDEERPLTPSLQSIAKMGTYPLQRAGAFADYLNKTSKRVSSLLATESMGYVEKVSGMWKGGGKHYDEPAGLRADDDDLEEDSEGKIQTSMERFRAHFALPDTERLQATYFGYILRVLPLYGKIYISDQSFCFRSLLPGTRTKLILPLKDIETVHKEKGFRFGYSGLVLVIRGHEELFFEFRQSDVRDDCAVTLLQDLETHRFLEGSDKQAEDAQNEDEYAAERDALKAARQEEHPERELELPHDVSSLPNAPTILLEDTDASFLSFKPPTPMKITCLTIGSRGDVQPYIALCKGLLAEGHKPRIATHAEFQGWVESHGIEFAKVEGDPAELMRLCIENGTFTLAFLREANSTFRGWLDELLDSAYTACEGSDLLIESPSAMAGIHIAEKLGIPYFRAFTMPWTRTRAYPHAFIMPEHKMGGAYNYMTYVMFDNIFWKATAQQVNRWRNKTLRLPNTSLEKMQPNKVPFLYNFSPCVVAPPLDFSDWIRITGYWFLDEGDNYTPPKELADFIQKARDDGKKLVYVGFGSIIVNDPAKMTREVIDAVLKADVRCILSKGWSDRISSKDDPDKKRVEEPEMPPEIHVIKSAPHDWLFKQIDAAAHHGGSGTTGASLRAGIPTIIRPFFGDQYFFASRVEDLGVGVWVKKWGTNSFGRALWEVTRNERMIVKAKVLGEQIRKDHGVDMAIQSIYRDMEYAKSLIKRKAGKNEQPEADEDDDETEESWTFVGGDEPDPDMVTKKLSEGLENLAFGGEKALKNEVTSSGA